MCLRVIRYNVIHCIFSCLFTIFRKKTMDLIHILALKNNVQKAPFLYYYLLSSNGNHCIFIIRFMMDCNQASNDLVTIFRCTSPIFQFLHHPSKTHNKQSTFCFCHFLATEKKNNYQNDNQEEIVLEKNHVVKLSIYLLRNISSLKKYSLANLKLMVS